MKYKILMLSLLIFTLLSGCSRGSETAEESVYIPTKDRGSIHFTASESEYLEDLRQRGGLQVATVLYPGVYERDENGGEKGFTCRMLRALEEFLDVPVTVRFTDFDDAFRQNGTVPANVKTDQGVVYTPDIFSQVDFLAFDLTDVRWRAKLMTIVPLVPTRVLLVNRRGDEIRHVGQLQHKRFTVFENTSHEVFLLEMADRLGFSIEIVPVPFGGDRIGPVLSGAADYAVSDAQDLVLEISDNPDFNISFPLTDIEMNGWAVAKYNTDLASILARFFDYARNSGIMDKAWREGFGISLDRYYSIIGYREIPVLRFDPEEAAYIEELARRGGLRAAVTDAAVTYERLDDGTISGIHYNLALEVARALGLSIRFIPVVFSDLFSKNGEIPERLKTDPGYSYTPDLLMDVDMYVSNLSPLPWRGKFLGFVELFPTKFVFVVRDDSPKVGIDELSDVRISLLLNSSYEEFLLSHYELAQLSVVEAEEQADTLSMVSDGTVDVTIIDANQLLGNLDRFRNLTIYPADDRVEMMSWAVARNNILLKRILEKTLAYLRDTGRFDAVWEDYYGITFREYLDLISCRGTE